MEIAEKKIPPKGLLYKIIEDLIEERLFNAAFQKTRETTGYNGWMEESISLSVIIRDKLGSDQSIFMKHEELSALCESALLKDAYKRGFLDGIEFKTEVL